MLSDVVRASTAAPTYFEPERIAIHSRSGSVVDGEFVDGGVSPHNDPALQLLMLAALEGSRLPLADGQEPASDHLCRHRKLQEFVADVRTDRRDSGGGGRRRAAIASGRLRTVERKPCCNG